MTTKVQPKAKSKKLETAQDKFQMMRADMDKYLIERHDEIDVVLTALICREHPLLVGPPGTAKSLLLDTLVKWMGEGTSQFSILFNKFTTPEEVFGPISVQGLKSDVYRRVTTNKLPEAHLFFADEIFKASSAILNTMLRILNERVYENGDGSFRKCPLRICVAASNEWPNEQDGGRELHALFDRFLFRKQVKPISSKSGREQLLWKPLLLSLSSLITADELDEAYNEAEALPWEEDAKEGMGEVLDALNVEGVRPGDRRMRKSVMAVQAFAYLCGADIVMREHLEILQHTLWDDPTEQPQTCAKIVLKIANPVRGMIFDKLAQVDEIVSNNKPTEAVPKLSAIQKELKAMRITSQNQSLFDDVMQHISSEIKTLYNQVIGL